MAGIIVDREKCAGCGLCVQSCGAGAIEIIEETAGVDEGKCTCCASCVEACPFGALKLEKEEEARQEGEDIWIYAELLNGKLTEVTLELVEKGRQLAEGRCRLVAVLMGWQCEESARILLQAGADRVLLLDDPIFASGSEEVLFRNAVKLVREYRPEAFLFGATMLGRSLAPRIAARLGTGLTADCARLEMTEGLLHQTRPAFGGNLMATIICPNRRPQMATVRPGVLPKGTLDHEGGEILSLEPVREQNWLEVLGNQAGAETESIADASIILSAGKGIGSRKNLKLLFELARKMGAKVGVSRPLVDMGWSEYSHQIGQTGVSVAPKLLIAFGISGAIQHLAGITNAGTVIAVNTDKDAPIFKVADYAVEADCEQVLRAMLEQLN